MGVCLLHLAKMLVLCKDHSALFRFNWQNTGNHLYSQVERCSVGVQNLMWEHNTKGTSCRSQSWSWDQKSSRWNKLTIPQPFFNIYSKQYCYTHGFRISGILFPKLQQHGWWPLKGKRYHSSSEFEKTKVHTPYNIYIIIVKQYFFPFFQSN